MSILEKMRNEFKGKEFTILGFYSSVIVDYGISFFKDEFESDIKRHGKTQAISSDDKEIYTIFAEIKEDKNGVGTIIQIINIEL